MTIIRRYYSQANLMTIYSVPHLALNAELSDDYLQETGIWLPTLLTRASIDREQSVCQL